MSTTSTSEHIAHISYTHVNSVFVPHKRIVTCSTDFRTFVCLNYY